MKKTRAAVADLPVVVLLLCTVLQHEHWTSEQPHWRGFHSCEISLFYTQPGTSIYLMWFTHLVNAIDFHPLRTPPPLFWLSLLSCAVCRGLIKNGERQDEESVGGRRRTEALRQLCQMNPSQALNVRAMAVSMDGHQHYCWSRLRHWSSVITLLLSIELWRDSIYTLFFYSLYRFRTSDFCLML